MAQTYLSNFIPQVWSARMLDFLDKAHVFGSVVNRDYEGEIKAFGDTVKINQIGDISISDYTKNDQSDTFPRPSELTSTQTTLKIDQAKMFNFIIDDIDAAQINPKVMDTAISRASYGLADVSDKFIAGMYVDAAVQVGTDAAPVTIKTTAAYEQLVALSQKLDENNVPTVGRFVIVPPVFYSQLLLDDRFIKAGTSKSDGVLTNGLVGEAAGFTIYKSNNVSVDNTGKVYHIMAGHPMGITFAQQVLSVEAYRPEKKFGNAVKGLMVYGAKVVQPKALAVLSASF